jgi:hypothetical protein
MQSTSLQCKILPMYRFALKTDELFTVEVRIVQTCMVAKMPTANILNWTAGGSRCQDVFGNSPSAYSNQQLHGELALLRIIWIFHRRMASKLSRSRPAIYRPIARRWIQTHGSAPPYTILPHVLPSVRTAILESLPFSRNAKRSGRLPIATRASVYKSIPLTANSAR